MLMPPFLMRPPKQDVLTHFHRVRDRVGLPYAVKWSHLEVSRIHDTRLLCGSEFPIFAGIDVVAFEALAAGADGWISGVPMIVPELAQVGGIAPLVPAVVQVKPYAVPDTFEITTLPLA